MRIWVTRTAPANEKTAARLRGLGHDVLRAPVLRVRRLDTKLLVAAPDAVVFTSGNGVRHHPRSSALHHLPVFTVGDATAEAARRSGYLDVRSAKGDVRDLQRLILDSLPSSSRLLHFAGRDLAGDLTGFLRRFGHSVDRRHVYAAEPVAFSSLRKVRAALPSIDGVLVHSPRAAERVARALTRASWRGKVWCISEACADKFVDLPGIELHVSRRPDDSALIDAVRRADLTMLVRRVSRLSGVAAPVAPEPANDNIGPHAAKRETEDDLDDPPPAA